MPIFRLLPLWLLIAFGAALVAAQSSPDKSVAAAPSTSYGQLNPSSPTDLLSLNPKTALSPANPLDRMHVGEFRPRFGQVDLPHTLLVAPPDVADAQFQNDTLCYAMRSYKVARDDPRSDSTHASGYSTCEPAKRFRVQSIKGVILPTSP
jgi:hypothetical protein